MHILRQTVVGAVILDVGTISAVENLHLGVFVETLEMAFLLLLTLVVDESHCIVEGDSQWVKILGD